MRYYKDINNAIYAYKNEALKIGLVEITIEEVEAINAQKAQDAFNALSYAEKRAREYPPMADYLDSVVKGDIVAQEAYINACLAIKAKYPKV